MQNESGTSSIGKLVGAGATTTGRQGLDYEVGISAETVDASAIHMQRLTIPPGARAKAHRHENHETAIYALTGVSAVWHGPDLQQHAVVPPGSFFYIPANVPHLPYNVSRVEPVIALIARTDPNEQESVVLMPELEALATPRLQPEPYRFYGTVVDVVVGQERTDGCWSLLRSVKPPGCETPAHLHRHDVETVVVTDGELHVEVGGHTLTLRPGDVAALPPDVPHRLSNRSGSPCEFYLLCTPAGFDGFVRALGEPVEGGACSQADLEPAAAEAGIVFLDEAALSESRLTSIDDVIRPFEPPLNALGMCIELQSAGGAAEDTCLLWQTLPPGGAVPLHTEPSPHVFVVLQGAVELYAAGLGGGWESISAPGAVIVPSNDPHALRNNTDSPVVMLRVTTQGLAETLRAVSKAADLHGAKAIAADAGITMSSEAEIVGL